MQNGIGTVRIYKKMKFIKPFSIFESTPEMAADLRVFLKDSGVSPDFVPHEDFHKYKWLLPKGKKSKWYYAKESNGIYQVPNAKDFLDTVDPEIREAVNRLHEMGMPTTPSCSGHFLNEGYYGQIHDDLIQECQTINTDGMEFIDPESGESHYVKDPGYKVPWNRSSFIERGMSHGHMGTIGVYDPSGKLVAKLSEQMPECAQIMEDGNLMLFVTNPKTEEEMMETWKSFTNSVKEL